MRASEDPAIGAALEPAFDLHSGDVPELLVVMAMFQSFSS
jgi:hypothetical protein